MKICILSPVWQQRMFDKNMTTFQYSYYKMIFLRQITDIFYG